MRQVRQGPGQEKSFIFVSPEQWFCGPYFVHSDFTKTLTLRLQIVSRPFLLCHKGKWQKEISAIIPFVNMVFLGSEYGLFTCRLFTSRLLTSTSKIFWPK